MLRKNYLRNFDHHFSPSEGESWRNESLEKFNAIIYLTQIYSTMKNVYTQKLKISYLLLIVICSMNPILAQKIPNKELVDNGMVTLKCTDDSYVQDGEESKKLNHGDEDKLRINKASPGYNRVTYIKFDLSQAPESVSTATLRLNSLQSSAIGTGVYFFTAKSDDWDQDNITGDNQPGADGIISQGVNKAGWNEVDITSEVKKELNGDGVLTIVVKSKDERVFYWSLEANNGNAPELVLEGNLGVGDVKANATTSIYPNPATNRISVKSSNVIQKASIYNIAGKRVLKSSNNSQKNNKFDININNLAAGLYLIRMEDNDGEIETKKFIKQ